MDIEDDGSSNKTDATEVVEDIERARSASPQKNTDNDGAFSIGQIARKFKQNKGTFNMNKDSDDDDQKGKNKSNKKTANINRSKTTMETESTTKPKKGKKKDDENMVQGPFSGTTIVLTGHFDQISRSDLEDLLKSLGA